MQTLDKTPMGCRPSQLLGPWLMESQAYDRLYDLAMTILSSPDQYDLVARQSAEQAKSAENAKPYVVENGIARFSITGPTTKYPTSMQSAIGGTATVPLQRAIRLAANDGFVQGAFVDIDSPGGTTAGAMDLANEFSLFRALKPLHMHVSGMGTSAAQLTSTEGDVVTVDPLGVMGSVGVLSQMRDTSELMKRAGIKDIYIASGDRKIHGRPGTVITDEQIAEVQKRVDATNEGFLESLARRRPRTKDHMQDIARAGVYDPRTAVKIGLADAVMTTEQAFQQFSQRIPFGSGRTLPG